MKVACSSYHSDPVSKAIVSFKIVWHHTETLRWMKLKERRRKGRKWRKVQQSCSTVQVFTRSKALGQHILFSPQSCRRPVEGEGQQGKWWHKLHYPTCYTCISGTYAHRGLITNLCLLWSLVMLLRLLNNLSWVEMCHFCTNSVCPLFQRS